MQTTLFEHFKEGKEPEITRTLNIITLFEDVAAGKRGKQVYDYLASHLGDEFEFNHQVWKLDVLATPSLRELAAKEGRLPNLIELLNQWGGVTVAYRRRLIDSPSYTLNHEEVEKALEEGIRFGENLSPSEIVVDASGHTSAIRFKRGESAGGEVIRKRVNR